MRKIALLAAMLVMAIVAGGCASMNAATAPTEEQIKQADFAAAPNPAGFEKAIRAWALDALKDPDAVQVRDLERESSKGWLTQCVEPGIPPYTDCNKRMFYFGHLVTAKLNTKNAMGGYIGFREYTFLFRGDVITRHAVGD